MTLHRLSVCVVTLVGCVLAGSLPAEAQGLLRSLPEAGVWVRYEGEYRETEFRPNDPTGDLELVWDRHLTIKCLERGVMAKFAGAADPDQPVACAWVELVVITGVTDEGLIDPGPAGKRIYKLLIPESRIASTKLTEEGIPVDDQGILVNHIPIVEGWRKIGDSKAAQIQSQVFSLYPVVSLLQHYRTIEQQSDQPEDAEVTLPDVTATRHSAESIMESPENRSTSNATLWFSDSVPFGVARWKVDLLRESKNTVEERTAFQQVSRITVEMKAAEKGNDAQSELATPAAGGGNAPVVNP